MADGDENPFKPEYISSWFWNIIAQAGGSRDNLRAILMRLGRDKVYRFQEEFVRASVELTDDALLRYIVPGESEDGVTDICHWVVSQGKQYYESVWADPQSIPRHVEGRSSEILYGVANEVYLERFGELTGIY